MSTLGVALTGFDQVDGFHPDAQCVVATVIKILPNLRARRTDAG